jgi:hypothetical protein
MGRRLLAGSILLSVAFSVHQMVVDSFRAEESEYPSQLTSGSIRMALLLKESWKQALLHHTVQLYNSFLLLNAVLVIWLSQIDLFYFGSVFISGVTSSWQLNLKINWKH